MNRTYVSTCALALCFAQLAACSSAEPVPQGADLASVSNAADAPKSSDVRADWRSGGHDLRNTRSQPLEQRISAQTADRLGVKWVFEAGGDVWATPAVDEHAVYVPDSAGNLFAVGRDSGALIWRRRVEDITGVPGVPARATPTLAGDVLYLGDQGGRSQRGARFFALDKRTGETLWVSVIDEQPVSRVTQSAVVFGDHVYVGLSSIAEQMSSSTPGFKCCSFRGNVVALERTTGKVVWRTYLTPGDDHPGYSGVAVWGGDPVVDVARNALYITTGNNYTVPIPILDCQALASPAQIEACVREVPGAEDNHFDAIVSLDLTTGQINWARSMIPFDTWSSSCVYAVAGNEGNCTDPHGEDYDFGQGVIAYAAQVDGRSRDILAVGQKSGIFWAVDPDDGSVIWQTRVGPGGSLGGMEWGSAFDGTRIYAAVANSGAKSWTLPSGEQTTGGLWAALDPSTGALLWQTRGMPAVTTQNQGAVSTANGVVFGGTIDRAGTMYAFDAETGATLWSFASGGSINTAPAIADGVVYWGSGYGRSGVGLMPNNQLYAFELDGQGKVPERDAGTDGGMRADAGLFQGPTKDENGAPTWGALYASFFAGTVGHCQNCHLPMGDVHDAHRWLVEVGQIAGTSSPISVRGHSRLTILGGGMPPGGPGRHTRVELDLAAWVAAGARDN